MDSVATVEGKNPGRICRSDILIAVQRWRIAIISPLLPSLKMPVAPVSAAVAAKYENDFYLDSHSPQCKVFRRVNYSEECNPDGTLTERALAYKREVRCLLCIENIRIFLRSAYHADYQA